MELSVTEFAKCMNLPQNIIERWLRQGRIPVKQRGDQLIFNLSTLTKWAIAHNLRFVDPGELKRVIKDPGPETLLAVMQKGGVYYDVPGSGVEEVLRAAVDRMAAVPTSEKQVVYETLLSREQMISTGIGNGVAIPHPRTPLSDLEIPAQIATCFLENPVPYHAIDKQAVFVLFVLVAPTAKLHLHLLSRLSFCLRDTGFMELLVQIPDRQTLFNSIAEFDRRLDTPGF